MIKVGKYTYGTDNLRIKSWGQSIDIEIGSFCSIAGNITIYVGGTHNTNWVTTFPFGHIHQEIFNKFDGVGHPKEAKNLIIGNDVWIGADSSILSGITIGDGAAIAANSHVVKSIPPYTIVGGNPAKYVAQRFDYSIVQKLLQLKWWNLPDNIINELSPFLCSSKISGLFKEAERLNLMGG